MGEPGTLKIALVGNPNCGKTTLFNRLTGNTQHVGNWPGVTVEKKVGTVTYRGVRVEIIDLPGVYSLTPSSPEEAIACRFLEEGEPDGILNVADATNLQRNLYLTTQLAELGIPMVTALNFRDVLEKRGVKPELSVPEGEFHFPFVWVSAYRGAGTEQLMQKLTDPAFQAQRGRKPPELFPPSLEGAISAIERDFPPGREISRRQAVRLLEGDGSEGVRYPEETLRRLRSKAVEGKSMDCETLIADSRYRFLQALCEEAAPGLIEAEENTLSDRIDRFATHRFLGIPIFLALLALIFFLTFGPVGGGLSRRLSDLIQGDLSAGAVSLLENIGAARWLIGLIASGILGGVGSVLSFLPQILLLFLLLSFLEDSGYLARIAFLCDPLLRKIGLSGKALVPMLMGFGCTVPAVMGARILEREKDRRLTVLITPFLSCSAKLPVYSLLAAAFFPEHPVLIVLSLYLLGIFAAIGAALFSRAAGKGEEAPFFMELPPYRFPSPKTLWLHAWRRGKDFLTKAGSVLLLASVAIWFLRSFTPDFQYTADGSRSILAAVGALIAPVFTPCGFGSWQAAVALASGLVAKESVLSTLSVLYQGELTAAVHGLFTPLSDYSFLIFVLLYTPCAAALGAIHRETGSIKRTLFTAGFQLFFAWLISALFFQWGKFFLAVWGFG